MKAVWQDNVLAWRKGAAKKFRITVTGDICPTYAGEKDILDGRSGEILADLKETLDRADLRLAQWEVVLTDKDTPILKCGPNLKVDPGCAAFLTDNGFDVALLANNHTGDFDENGVLDTLDVLKKAKIRTVGAGPDAAAARKPLRMTRNGFKITIFNICEHEFGCAWEDHAGSNAMDELVDLEEVRNEKGKADIILVVIHGGNETNPIPSPRVKKLCRAFAGAGASAVMNIHTHCPQGIEVVKGVPIVYCPGNFFFPRAAERFDAADFWWSGYLPTFVFDRSGACAVEVTPYIQEPHPWKIRALAGEEKKWLLNYLQKISAEMLDNGDHWFDVWCATHYTLPLELFAYMDSDAFTADPENADALQKLPRPRNMMTCPAHNELSRRVMLLLERKKIKKLLEDAPRLEEMRIARFSALPGGK